jgi:hypothetical protein
VTASHVCLSPNRAARIGDSLFKISARTVLELGSELISSDVIAIYELIKNGFGAGSRSGVDVRFEVCLRKNDFLTLQTRIGAHAADLATLHDEIEAKLIPSASQEALSLFRALVSTADTHAALSAALEDAQRQCNSIIVSDTGLGMSADELSRNFLVIGTASRKHEVEAALRRGESATPFLGEKGIGRLSAMRLGERLRVETAHGDEPRLNILEIDWSAFANLDAMLDDIDVKPSLGGPKPSKDWQGTRIIITDLAEDWTERRVRDMAGVGLMVEVVAHELARASENALSALERLHGRPVPEEIRAQVEILRSEMKSISKRVRVLDPLSISGRQRTELFSLSDLISDTVEAHDAQFKRQGIDIEVSLPDRPLRVRAVKGMVIQILENLISNSIYWLALRSERARAIVQAEDKDRASFWTTVDPLRGQWRWHFARQPRKCLQTVLLAQRKGQAPRSRLVHCT